MNQTGKKCVDIVITYCYLNYVILELFNSELIIDDMMTVVIITFADINRVSEGTWV